MTFNYTATCSIIKLMNYIIDLPLELLSSILAGLDPNTLIHLSTTSKHNSSLLTHEYDILWQYLLNSKLQKPYKYTYNNIHEYNTVNHTQHANWFRAYIHLIHNITHVEDTSFKNSIQNGHFEIFRLLLHNPDTDIAIEQRLVRGYGYHYIRTKTKTLSLASTLGHVDILQELLNDSRFDPCDQQNYVLIKTCELGQVQSLRVLLSDPRIDPSCNNNGAIVSASRHGKSHIVAELLKDSRVNPCDKSNSAIFSVDHNDIETKRILLNDRRVIQSLCGDIIKTLEPYKKSMNPPAFKLYASIVLTTLAYVNPNGVYNTYGGKLLLEALVCYMMSDM